jgi:hypothetical protein
MKKQSDKMAFSQKQQVDKMASEPKYKFTKWQIDKTKLQKM